MKELTLIIPVYNEESIIQEVIVSWLCILRSLKIDFIIKAYNDGSTDRSLSKLLELEKCNEELSIIDKSNTGHGATILEGYKSANSKWVFQVDSDNEVKSSSFTDLWKAKNNYDLVIGSRKRRKNNLTRRFVSFVSRIVVRMFYGTGVKDVNSPYRLFRMDKFYNILRCIPSDSFAPNILLTGFAIKKNLRTLELSVPYNHRSTGIVSIKKLQLLKAVFKSFVQTIYFSLVIKYKN